MSPKPNVATGQTTLLGNVTANFALRTWTILQQIFLTPIVIHTLGPENYGMVGFSATLSACLFFLDQAITPALTRELARLGSSSESAREARNLVRTAEVISYFTAICVGGAVVLLAPQIAEHGIAGGGLPSESIVTAVRWTGFGVACQWPSLLYSGAFVGLQRQDAMIWWRLLFSALAPLGALFVMWVNGPTIDVFLMWIAVVSLFTSSVMAWMVWQCLPSGPTPQFDVSALRRVWRYATGNLLIGFTTVLLAQTPALLVAKFRPLASVSAYLIALSLAQQLTTILTQPISGSLLPHLAQQFAKNDEAGLAKEYHRWSQLLVALALPVAATLIWFPMPILRLWLGAKSPLLLPISELLPYAACGCLLNAMITPTYLLQSASGWTRMLVVMNAVLILVYVPGLFFLIPIYGEKAAAMAPIALNGWYMLAYVYLVHRRILPKELTRFWLLDNAAPALSVAAVFGAAVCVMPQNASFAISLAWLIVALVGSVLVLWLTLPLIRNDSRAVLMRSRSHVESVCRRYHR